MRFEDHDNMSGRIFTCSIRSLVSLVLDIEHTNLGIFRIHLAHQAQTWIARRFLFKASADCDRLDEPNIAAQVVRTRAIDLARDYEARLHEILRDIMVTSGP